MGLNYYIKVMTTSIWTLGQRQPEQIFEIKPAEMCNVSLNITFITWIQPCLFESILQSYHDCECLLFA